MMKKTLLSILILIFVQNIFAGSHYVSSDAGNNGDGSYDNPWQFQKAFDNPPALLPGDTIWLRGGIYTNSIETNDAGVISYICRINGTPDAPVIFRNYNNERVTIDAIDNSVVLFLSPQNCSYVWFWGLEIMSSSIKPRDYSPKEPAAYTRGKLYCQATGIRFINMVIHDLSIGVSLGTLALENETYGNIIYNIGYDGPGKGHGHGIYAQNGEAGVMKIHDNILFSSFGNNVNIWSTNQTVNNFDIQNNIVFNGGSCSQSVSRKHNFFIVSNNSKEPIRNLMMKHNYTYAGNTTTSGSCNTIGANYGSVNMQLDSNYFLGQLRLAGPYENFSATDNFIYGGTELNYIAADAEISKDQSFWEKWVNTVSGQNLPESGMDYFVIPNKYEKGRANIVIYNWEKSDEVQIDISNSGLQPGDKYELVNVMDYYNDIITDVMPSDGIISVPMINHTFAKPVASSKEPVSQFPEFGVFVVRKVVE